MASLDHIIVLMMENNSFDRMLGALFPERDGGGGIKGSESKYWNVNPKTGQKIYLKPTNAQEVKIDPGHELADVKEQLSGPFVPPGPAPSGPCQGYVSNYVGKYAGDPQEIMGYYPEGFLPVLHSLARNFTVCDRWFSSVPGPTWPNRFFVNSGTSMGYTTNTGGPSQYTQRTIFDTLSDAGLHCMVYYHDVSQTAAFASKPPLDSIKHFLNAVGGPEANFPKYCFIEPHYGILSKQGQNDQHPPCDVFSGEKLIDEVYKALRANDALWQRSLLVITYDEHGGFYDHVVPPAADPPDSHVDPQFNFDRLGVRVPTILVSPWLNPGVIQDTFDHTSLLKFMIDKWGLTNYHGNRVAAANTFKRYLRSSPRIAGPASKIPTAPAYMPAQAGTELNDNQKALMELCAVLAAQIEDPVVRAPLVRKALKPTEEAQAQLAVQQFQAFLFDKAKQSLSAKTGGRSTKRKTAVKSTGKRRKRNN
jgi:phospholipase C